MLGYLLIILLMVAWYIISVKLHTPNYRQFLIGMAVIMTLFYGLRRYDVGSDTISYINMFTQDGQVSIDDLWDYMWKKKSPVFVLCEWLFYRALPYPQLWLIATSAFFFFVFSKFVAENSDDPFFSYFLFFTIFGTFQMTGVRQSCAMAVFMLAYRYVKERKLIKYLLMIGLAYLVHKSAIVLLPIYFLRWRRVRLIDIPLLILVLFYIYSNRSALFDYIKGFTSYAYFEELKQGEPINFSLMIYASTLFSSFLCYHLYRNIKKSKAANRASNETILMEMRMPMYALYTNAMYLASVFMPLVAVNGAVRRIVMYFSLFIIFIIPKGLREIFGDGLCLLLLKLLLCAFLTYLLLYSTLDSSYSYHLFEI